MRSNRSMPAAAVIPVLAYDDLAAAVAFLRDAFGFVERLRIHGHRVQLVHGDGAVVATEGTASPGNSIMVRVEDVDAHCARAEAHGARILARPATFPYGERQYTAADPAGYVWTFSQSLDDVDPAAWGGELVQ